MNLTFKIATLLLLAISLISCATSKDKKMNDTDYIISDTPPFSIMEAYSQDWVAGIKGGGSGTNVLIKFSTVEGNVVFKDLYYKKLKAPLKNSPVNSITYQASFKSELNNDTVMDSDSKKEAANTPPFQSPFNLNDKEVVISYLENNQLKFFKISGLPKKPMIAYPSAPPGNSKQ